MGAAVAIQFDDSSSVRLQNENEIDNAIYALLCAAFGEGDDPELRLTVRARLPQEPTPAEVIDALCGELRLRGRLSWEWQRRATASNVMAAFLDLSPADRADLSLAPPQWE
jgi:hypothetical protein